MIPTTATSTTPTGTPALPPLPFIRSDHLLLAMDVVAYLAREPNRRGFSPRAVNDVIRERLGWFPRRSEADDLFERLVTVFERLWTRRAPEGPVDHYNVVPFLDFLRLRASDYPHFVSPDGFERLLRAIASGELTEADFRE